MALVDLLDKIESFDYNQVGKPQTFEANGGTVTGQQSFERPIEVPLPVQETLLGYGERTSAQNFLQNAVIDGLDTSIAGFTKEMTETQFQFIVGETSNFEPFYSQGTYGFQSPADFQFPDPVNFFSNTYVNGFTKNTSPEGIGPSDNSDFNIISGETSTFNVSTKFGDVNYTFPFNTNFFEDTYAKGFNSNRSPEGIGPSSTTNFSPIISDPGGAGQGTSTYNDSVTFVGLSEADLPELQTPSWSNVFEVTAIPTNTVPTTTQIVGDDAQTYAWTADGPGETSAFAVNFFDKDGENPYVSGFTLDTSPIGIGPGTTEITDSFTPSYGGYTFANSGVQTFQSSLNVPTINFIGTEDQEDAFRRRAGRFVYEDMMSNSAFRPSSNFLNTEENIVTDFLVKTDRTIYHKTDGENENYKVSARAGRGFPNNFYRPKVTGDGASRTLPFELAEVAKDRFDDENRIMLPPVNADGEADGTNIGSRPYGLEFSDPANGAKELISGYTSYVQDMSSTDGDQPFIVRRMGNDWGVDFLGDPGFIQNLAGGFMRTPGSPTHNFGGRLHREATDLKRKIKFISTSDGASFVVKQFLLQSQNRTMESRIYNPLSLASIQGLVGIERNFLFGTTYEGILGGNATPPQEPDTGTSADEMKGDNATQPSRFEGVIDFVKKIIPDSPIQSYIDKYLGRKEDIDGIAPIPTSRNKWQALYGEWGDVTSGTADIEKATETATKKKADPPEAQTDQSQGEEEGFDFGQAASDLAAGAADLAAGALKKLKSLFPGAKELKFSMHNPNQYYKIDPLGIYGNGGADAAKSLMDRLTSASDRHTTVTFAKKKNSLQQKKEQYDYHYNLYGAIPTEKSKEREYSGVNVTKADDTKKKKADRYPQGITAKNYHKQIQSWNNSDPKQRDLVNGAPLMDEDRYDSTKIPDFVDFKFRVKSYGDYESGEGVTNTSKNKILIFSAIINSLSDAVSPEYNEVRYLGRPDKFYTYNGVDRDISVSFTLYPKTRQEFPFLAEKLNYLVGLTYPQYSATNAMLAPYVDLTLGDMFNNQPGYISSLNVNVQDNTTWEIDAFQFPKHITCDLTFRLIGRHVPHQFGKHYDLPWLSVSEDAKNYGSTIFSNDFNNPNLTMYGPTYRIPGKGVGSEWTEVNALNQNLLTNAYMAPLDVSKRPGQDDSSGAGEADE